MPSKIGYFIFCYLPRPSKKITVNSKRFEFAPENQANGLKKVICIFPIPNYGKDVPIELMLMACNQFREQVVTLLFSHLTIH